MRREPEQIVWSREDRRGNRLKLIVRGHLDDNQLDVIQEWIDWIRKQERANAQG